MSRRERGIYPAPDTPIVSETPECLDCRELRLDLKERQVNAKLVALIVEHGPQAVFAQPGFSRRELGRAMTIMQRHAYSLHCLLYEDAEGYDRLRDEQLEVEAKAA